MAEPVPVHVRLPICCVFGYSCICRLNVHILSIDVPVAVRLSVCQGVKKFGLNEENGYNEPVKSSQVDKLPVPGSQYLQTKTSSEKYKILKLNTENSFFNLKKTYIYP